MNTKNMTLKRVDEARYFEGLEHLQYGGCQGSYAYSSKSSAAYCNGLKEADHNTGAQRDRLDGWNSDVED